MGELHELRLNSEQLKERFLRYVAVHTTSNPKSTAIPSSEQQWDLLRLLESEARAMGAGTVTLDERGFLKIVLGSTPGLEQVPVVAFLAHVDTSPDLSGLNVRPQVIEHYSGGDIPLGSEYTLSPTEYPELLKLLGHTLITTDGSTLLGSDDKSGVAVLMEALLYLTNHPELAHGPIIFCFTTDEEIGRGVEGLDPETLGARFAYTIDGGAEGELSYENFNAAHALVQVKGRNIHPGSANGKMINAAAVAQEFHALLMQHALAPEESEHREGFIHLTDLSGCVEECRAEYIVRAFNEAEFTALCHRFTQVAEFINRQYQAKGAEPIQAPVVTHQYSNMASAVQRFPQMITKARRAMELSGVVPIEEPIRGGTDGAQLSAMGIPCPNLFTGGANFHGRFEYCSLQSMTKSLATVLNLIQLWSQDA